MKSQTSTPTLIVKTDFDLRRVLVRRFVKKVVVRPDKTGTMTWDLPAIVSFFDGQEVPGETLDLRVLILVLNQAVKRHGRRFPKDFMFQLSRAELENWRSQFVTSNPDAKMGLRRPPYVFTEHGVAMLSSVLNSERAIQVNIAIMRAFVKLREMIAAHRGLARKLGELEKKYDAQFKVVFAAIRELMEPPVPRVWTPIRSA